VNRTTFFASVALASGVASLGASGCARDVEPAASSDAHFALEVAPLSLEGVGGASYALTVRSALTGATGAVWSRAGMTSARYGDGVGALSYVGPCDASAGANPHRIELVLESLSTTEGDLIDPATYLNPAPAGAPIVVEADCLANADVAVEINLTVMRTAQQGFFDVAVNFDDVFCSAKLDCQGEEGPIELLYDPADGARKTTVVLGFACTTGPGQLTWLHFSDVSLSCDGVAPMVLDPSGAPGNNGSLGVGPSFFQTGIYRGIEAFEGLDKCYWNMALGVNLGEHARNCHLNAQATASDASFLPSGASPPGTVSPYIAFDLQLTDDAGALSCTNHPLGGADGAVAATYTPWAGAPFTHEWSCSPSAIVYSARLGCGGAFEGGVNATCTPTADGLSVTVAGVRSPTYTLPAGYFVGDGAACCVNPCCAETAP